MDLILTIRFDGPQDNSLLEGETMTRYASIILLALVAVGTTGCIVISTEKVEKCPPPVVVPSEPTIAEIDAVGKLAFDHDRCAGYLRIAAREGLSDAAQVHLIDAACRRLDFENMRMDVLLALVDNPCFGPVGEAALLERLNCLDFEHNKRKILDVVGARRDS